MYDCRPRPMRSVSSIPQVMRIPTSTSLSRSTSRSSIAVPECTADTRFGNPSATLRSRSSSASCEESTGFVVGEWRHPFGPEGTDAPLSVRNDVTFYDCQLAAGSSVDCRQSLPAVVRDGIRLSHTP